MSLLLTEVGCMIGYGLSGSFRNDANGSNNPENISSKYNSHVYLRGGGIRLTPERLPIRELAGLNNSHHHLGDQYSAVAFDAKILVQCHYNRIRVQNHYGKGHTRGNLLVILYQ